MPRANLTQLSVDRLRPPSEGSVTFWDKNLPGFGVRVSARGRKTWVAMYRVSGRSVMESIATMAVMPSLRDARDAARASMTKARAGTHPIEERRAAARAREVEAATAEAAALEEVEGRVEAVVERFLAEHVERNCSPRYAREVRRIFQHDVLPRWGGRPIRGISKHDVNEILDTKARTRERPHKTASGGAAVQANKTLARLRTLFGWAASHDLIDVDPTVGVLLRAKERARDRVLGDDEIIWLWRGSASVGWPLGPIFRLLLLTAQREGEFAGMRWSEVNLEERTWTIPGSRAKNGKEHVVHLSQLAIEVIEGLPRIAGDLLFPGRNGQAIVAFAYGKDRLDAAMEAQLREATGNPDARLPSWVIHDLRWTATTIMARLGIAPHVADKVLNHQAGTIRGVAAIYNRFEYINERKAALEALGRFIESLVQPSGQGNVVPLRA